MSCMTNNVLYNIVMNLSSDYGQFRPDFFYAKSYLHPVMRCYNPYKCNEFPSPQHNNIYINIHVGLHNV